MTQEEAQTAVAKHGSIRKASKVLAISREHLAAVVRGTDVPKLAHVKPQSRIPVKSLKDFRNIYDQETIVPQRVETALKELGVGWLYEMEFGKLANVTSTQLSVFRDRYAANIVTVRDSRRIWVGKASVAEDMRRML